MDLSSLPLSFSKQYELGRTLSTTERAVVHAAVQIATRRPVAVKFFADAAALQRLAPLVGLRHPNVAGVLETGEAGGIAYAVLELAEGGSLADAPAQALTRAADIALDCLKGLAAARRRGLASALEPEHVLIAEGGQARVAGLAPADSGAESDGRAVAALLTGMLAAAEVPASIASLIAPGTAPAADALAAALRPHASRAAALVEPAPAAAAAAAAPMPAAEPLPARPIVVAGGQAPQLAAPARTTGGAHATLVLDPIRLDELAGSAGQRTIGLVAFFGGMVLLGLVGGLAALALWRPPAARVIEQARDVRTTSLSISWRTDRPCYSYLEYWQATSTQTKLRTKHRRVAAREHRHELTNLKPDTTYNFRFITGYEVENDGELTASEVFDVTTRPEVQIFNIHVDEYATKAVVTWETNLRTDTTIKYGRTDQYEDLRTNPEQRSESIHSITVEGLSPDTTYHYRILSSDPRGRGQPKESEDLLFRTSKEDEYPAAQRENAGLVNLTKSYVDKLTRMTPDEREKLKRSINAFTRRPIGHLDKKAVVAGRTDLGAPESFHDRLRWCAEWLYELKAKGRILDAERAPRLLQALFYTNKLQAAQRLDALLQALAAAEGDESRLLELEQAIDATGTDLLRAPPSKPVDMRVPPDKPDDLDLEGI